jgi:hypothetical protein
MFKVIPWSRNLNLDSFYKLAGERGNYNNSSEEKLIGGVNRYEKWQAWILYYKDKPVGSVAAHSFDDVMGANTFRIAARSCVLTDQLEGAYGSNRLRTVAGIRDHQNATAQFLVPTCIYWAPKPSRLFLTTNESAVGTQRLMHNICAPIFEKQKEIAKIKTVSYRGSLQTVWEVYPDVFLKNISRVKKWPGIIQPF